MQQNFKNAFSVLGFLILLMAVSGCHNYYKISAGNVNTSASKSVDSLKIENRYFVLRTPAEAYYMRNVVLSEDRKKLTATLDTLPLEHTVYLKKGRGKMRYKSTERSVLSEVHMYVNEATQPPLGKYTFTLDQVQKIEVIEKDRKKTTNSYVIGTLGYTLGTIALAGVIIAATKSSCPFVSAYDGDGFALQGEIYGGAIYPQMIRHDYLPLKMSPATNGNLQIKISNELQEKQFTDIAELLVIKHDKNKRVLADAEGNVYNIQNPEAPITGFLSSKKDVKEYLLYADKKLLFLDDTSAANGYNSVVLQFNKPQRGNKGKLVLSLKNSYWLDYLYGELAKGFGSSYNIYTKQQHKKPATQLNKWIRDQQIPLEVSIKTNEGWQKITDITTVGPVAVRDMVIPVDLSSIKSPVIEIKLSAGYLFWELDYAAMDFSPDKEIQVQILKPSAAHDETGKDVLDVVLKEDTKYLSQPVPGTVATLEYKWKAANNSNEAYTFILHTKGYYEHVRNFKGIPRTKFLEQFKKPGAFPQYSVQRFKEFNKEQIEMLSSK